jgi:hypothetical protein
VVLDCPDAGDALNVVTGADRVFLVAVVAYTEYTPFVGSVIVPITHPRWAVNSPELPPTVGGSININETIIDITLANISVFGAAISSSCLCGWQEDVGSADNQRS